MPNEVTGMNSRTLKMLSGWDYVVQSVEEILSTPYFTRVMRPYVGSNAHKLLGELANPKTAMRFRVAVALAILLFVPNFRPVRIDIIELDSTGATGWVIEGWYYPRGHKGDLSGATYRQLFYGTDLRVLSSVAV